MGASRAGAPASPGLHYIHSGSDSLGFAATGFNLMTGAATRLGEFNGTLSGLTVSAVPEPGTYALMLAGLGVLGFSAKRRRVNSAR